jgi:hypothetical protein
MIEDMARVVNGAIKDKIQVDLIFPLSCNQRLSP